MWAVRSIDDDAATRLRRTEARFGSLAELSTDVVYRITHDPLQVDYVSPSVQSLLGITPAELYADPTVLARIVHPEDLALLLAGMRPDERRPRVRLRFVHPDGHVVHTEAASRPLLDEHGRKIGGQGALRDITGQHALEAELARLADEDALTGLANRRALFRHLHERLTAGGPTGVVFVDLDGFKAVNDAYGHDVGDRFLAAVADRLRGVVGAGDLLARLAGDEFVVVCAAGDLAHRSAAVVAALGGTVRLTGHEVVGLAASVGVAVAAVGERASSVLARADAAMYAHKRRAR